MSLASQAIYPAHAWPEPVAYLKVRQRGGQAVILDAEPSTPPTALAALNQMTKVGQVVAFDFWHPLDLERFRKQLYMVRHKGGTRHYITRSHGPWVMVMRIE